jgi:hypothetical protein
LCDSPRIEAKKGGLPLQRVKNQTLAVVFSDWKGEYLEIINVRIVELVGKDESANNLQLDDFC